MVQWKEMFTTKPGKVVEMPGINMVEGKNKLLQVVLCPLLLYCGVCVPPQKDM